MFGNEGFQAVLASADRSDMNTFRDHLVCHGFSYSRGRSNEENVLVRERHSYDRE